MKNAPLPPAPSPARRGGAEAVGSRQKAVGRNGAAGGPLFLPTAFCLLPTSSVLGGEVRRGFTLLETTVALGVLFTALIAAWSVVGGARRSERALWDEFAANELATSLLERVYADGNLQPTKPEGAPVALPSPEPLPGAKATLFVAPASDRADMVEIKAVVQWTGEVNAQPCSVERTIRRRAQP